MQPSLDSTYLGAISSDFVKVADKIKEASYWIRERGGYTYPLFLMAPSEIALGTLLIAQNELDNQWYYYAAYLDALVQSGLIDPQKLSDFKQHYKDPDEYCCLLVVEQAFTNFIYIPYPVD
jgi:hypothetical protein